MCTAGRFTMWNCSCSTLKTSSPAASLFQASVAWAATCSTYKHVASKWSLCPVLRCAPMRLDGGSHKQIYDQGGSPLIFSCVEPERKPPQTTTTYKGFQTEIHFKPRASPHAELRPGRLPTRRITTREANYDRGAHPQAELRPGSWLAGWLAGWGDCDQETCHALGWLADWLGGWLAG